MPKLSTHAFDSADFLDTPEAVAAYLADALASGSDAEYQDALSVVARAANKRQNSESLASEVKK